MGELKARLQDDLTAALRARDQLRLGTLRLALTAVKDDEVRGKAARELSDDEVVTVLAREARKRREAAEAYDAAARPEQAARERAEGEVLNGYLPAQLSDDEITEIVDRVLPTLGASGPRAMGQAMKAVNAEVAGRAEGGRVAAVVRARLAAS